MAEPFSQDMQGREIATYAYDQVAVAGAALLAGTTLGTAANWNGCKRIIVTVETATVRVRVDGTSPTAAIGTPYTAGSQFIIFGPDVQTLRMIAAAGSATVNIEYAR